MLDLPRLTDDNVISYIKSLIEQLEYFLTHVDTTCMTSDMVEKWAAMEMAISSLKEQLSEIQKNQWAALQRMGIISNAVDGLMMVNSDLNRRIKDVAHPVGSFVLWHELDDSDGVCEIYGGEEWNYQGSFSGGIITFYIYRRLL